MFITGDHYDVCPDVLLPCSITGCREQVKRRNVNSHEEICPKRVVPCPYAKVGCTLTFKNEDITKHKQEHVEKHLSLAVEKFEQLEIQQQKQQIAPLVLKIEKFDGSTPVRSQPFYTSKGGYKMSLLVKPNGFNRVSCSIDLMPGEYDDTLEWPFRGKVTVEILNQLGDRNHSKHTVNYPQTYDDEPLQVSCIQSPFDYSLKCYNIEDEEYQEEISEYEEKVEETHYQPTQQHACESKKTNEREYGKIGEISSNLISYDDDLGQFLPESISLVQFLPESISLTQEKAMLTNTMRPMPTKRNKHTSRNYSKSTSPSVVPPELRIFTRNWTSSEEIEPHVNVQFLVNGTLYLRVNVQAHSQTKPWLY